MCLCACNVDDDGDDENNKKRPREREIIEVQKGDWLHTLNFSYFSFLRSIYELLYVSLIAFKYVQTHTQMLASTPMKYREDIIAQFLFYERKMQRKFKDQLGHTLFLAFVRTQKINYLSSSSCVLSGNSINIILMVFFPKNKLSFMTLARYLFAYTQNR